MVALHHSPQQEYRMDRTPDDNEMHHDDVDDDDELSRTSADWGLTNRSVALTNAVADPWNHPLLMDCDDDDDDDGTNNAYRTCLHDSGHAIPTLVLSVVKQARVSMDVTESWMTDAHHHHHHHDDGPLWMEGLELDPILTEVSTTIATSLSGSLFHSSWNRPSRNDMELNPALYDDDDDALNLMIMDEMECVLKNEVATQATECSGSVSSDGAVEGSILTIPSPPSSFGIVPFNTVIPTSLCQESTTVKESPATSTAQTATNEVPVVIVSSAQFQERREMLAASMRASQISRQCLHMKENVQRRQVLQKVLTEIAQSTATVQHHCLQIPPTSAVAENEPLMVNGPRHSSLSPTTPAKTAPSKEPDSNVLSSATETVVEPLQSATTVDPLDNPEVNSSTVPMAALQAPKEPKPSENDENSIKCQNVAVECLVVLDQESE
jgi:hypothetical protein